MRHSVLLLVLAALALVPGCAQGATAGFPHDLGSWENRIVFYLEAQSATSGPFLSPDADAVGTASYTSTTNGAAALPAAIGAKPPALEFKLNTVLAKDQWFNLSKPVAGAIYWQSLVSASSTRESAWMQIQVFAGDKRIGGDEMLYPAQTAYKAWVPFIFKFRPEQALLLAGESITLRVYHSNYADLNIGTGGNQQSYIEFRTFDEDPLKSGFYLDGARTLVVAPPAKGSSDGAAFLAFAILPVLGLVARPRRPRALLVACLFVAGVFAGCAGKPGDPKGLGLEEDPDAPRATAETETQEDEGLRLAGQAAVEGYVVDGGNAGLPLKDANVAFVGTSLSAYTDAKGHFRFLNVTPNTYLVRVDAKNYAPLEQSLVVEKGARTWLNVSLVRPGGSGGDLGSAHTHDMWGEDTRRVIVDGVKFKPASYLVDTGAYWNTIPGCCDRPIPLPEGTQILPGTSHVEVKLTWSGPQAPRELGLRIMTPANKSLDQFFVPRPSGIPFNIRIFPNEADPGHQRGTDWQMFIVIPKQSALTHPWGQAAYLGEPIGLHVTIEKGVVPYEPQHRTFWNDRSELLLFKEVRANNGIVCCASPYYPGPTIQWIPPAGAFVPPGSKEIKGTLTWDTMGAPAGIPWKLLYKTAADSPTSPTWRPVPGQSQGVNGISFTLPVAADQTDQFYQQRSRWIFSVDNDIPDAVAPYLLLNEGWPNAWVLSATVHKDPAYTEA